MLLPRHAHVNPIGVRGVPRVCADGLCCQMRCHSPPHEPCAVLDPQAPRSQDSSTSARPRANAESRSTQVRKKPECQNDESQIGLPVTLSNREIWVRAERRRARSSRMTWTNAQCCRSRIAGDRKPLWQEPKVHHMTLAEAQRSWPAPQGSAGRPSIRASSFELLCCFGTSSFVIPKPPFGALGPCQRRFAPTLPVGHGQDNPPHPALLDAANAPKYSPEQALFRPTAVKTFSHSRSRRCTVPSVRGSTHL